MKIFHLVLKESQQKDYWDFDELHCNYIFINMSKCYSAKFRNFSIEITLVCYHGCNTPSPNSATLKQQKHLIVFYGFCGQGIWKLWAQLDSSGPTSLRVVVVRWWLNLEWGGGSWEGWLWKAGRYRWSCIFLHVVSGPLPWVSPQGLVGRVPSSRWLSPNSQHSK